MNDMSITDDRQVAHIFPLRFWTDFEGTDGAELREVDWVEWTRKGSQNGTTTSDKVIRVQKDPAKWDAIKPYYRAWKEKTEAVIEGYALDAWPGVTAQQAKVLKDRHVLSVEDLANSSEADLVKIGLPGIRLIQQKAKAFLEARKSTAPVAAEVAQLREENKTMREELEAAMQLLKELNEKETSRRGKAPKEDA
ncbi:hypothetical protein HJB79_31490 [Rhizobium lentis]|uniref:hypothetical protein n=1 Tax=Rhizobium lentis TaxID=1138194 RepID=UPI001C833360|nr:hypothetical protein [Rhizobium lentis]MBX5143234.1 hypothetical protein [Rhizobium lentis]